MDCKGSAFAGVQGQSPWAWTKSAFSLSSAEITPGLIVRCSSHTLAAMLRYALRRLALAILVTVTVLVISFALTRLSGDLAASIAGPDATAEDIAIIRKEYGLDRPLTVQFFDWARRAAEGDLGDSYLYHAPVSGLVATRLPITLTLGGVGLVFALAIALPLGILAALYEGSAIDRLLSLVALIGQAMPSFWLGLLLIIWFGLDLHWLPISGVEDWTGYILPGFVLSFSAIPALLRLMRTGMIEALGSDYIRTARAKGLSARSIVLKHALRNAAMPVVAVGAVQLGFMLGGSIVVEEVFALHGVGYLAWESVSKNDFPVVQAVVLLLAVIYIALTLLADLCNAMLDPRLRSR
jgi:peptide/nickel transport system permease protein